MLIRREPQHRLAALFQAEAFQATLHGEAAWDSMEHEINCLASMDQWEFLALHHPQWEALVKEVEKRELTDWIEWCTGQRLMKGVNPDD